MRDQSDIIRKGSNVYKNADNSSILQTTSDNKCPMNGLAGLLPQPHMVI